MDYTDKDFFELKWEIINKVIHLIYFSNFLLNNKNTIIITTICTFINDLNIALNTLIPQYNSIVDDPEKMPDINTLKNKYKNWTEQDFYENHDLAYEKVFGKKYEKVLHLKTREFYLFEESCEE